MSEQEGSSITLHDHQGKEWTLFFPGILDLKNICCGMACLIRSMPEEENEAA